MEKLERVIERLVQKIKLSQTPVPGFIMGLSGTDSIAAFAIAYNALQRAGIPQDRLLGIHYVHEKRRTASWFERDIVPWMREMFSDATILVVSPLGGNHDQMRWADLHLRALNHVTQDGSDAPLVRSRDREETYWVAGTINATEKMLGKYAMLSNAVSIQIIQSIYKSEIMQICQNMGVPPIALDNARQPDCFCGREEIAAQNIEMIDEILTFRFDPKGYVPLIVSEVFAYIAETKRMNDFKTRTPFVV